MCNNGSNFHERGKGNNEFSNHTMHFQSQPGVSESDRLQERSVGHVLPGHRMDLLRGLVSVLLPPDLFQLEEEKVSIRKTPAEKFAMLDFCVFSVVGLNFDFTALNIIGFSLYGIFNLGLYCIPEVQVRTNFIFVLVFKIYNSTSSII